MIIFLFNPKQINTSSTFTIQHFFKIVQNELDIVDLGYQ